MTTNPVADLFHAFANTDYIGEAISQQEHSLQCAYFAKQLGHSNEVVIASLLHDIGHVALSTPQPQMAGLGVINHEWIGARLAIEAGLPRKVGMLIGYHVEAKRYLAYKKKAYFDKLSEASKGTLAFQGGPMSEMEAKTFEALPLFREALQVRTHDEKGKVVDLDCPDFASYLPLIESMQISQRQSEKRVTFYDKQSCLPTSLDKQSMVLSKEPQELGSEALYCMELGLNQESPEFNLAVAETTKRIQGSAINNYYLLASPEMEQALSLSLGIIKENEIA